MKEHFKSSNMKTTIAFLFLSLFIACNENPKKAQISKPDTVQVLSKQVETNTMKSGDYSTLLVDYTCDLGIAEVAKVFNVPESELRISDNVRKNACSFDLNGYSENEIRGSTQISWGPVQTSKAQNKKEIKGFLERKEEGVSIMGMDIQLADTGDCYLAYLPVKGRLVIYNENYDKAFIMNYGTKNSYQRTPEKHEELRLKMTDLANYLLKKHRK